MGTNYYCRKIPTKQRKAELCELINTSNNFDEIMQQISYTYGGFRLDIDNKPIGGVIHLGKRSGGWKFLWNPNVYVERHGHLESEELEPGHTKSWWIEEPDTYYHIYPLTKEGIWNFINQEDIEVFDEYGELQDKKEFFEMALHWTTWNGEEAYDGKSYEESLRKKGKPSLYLPKETDKDVQILKKCGYKVEWPFTDFYSDELRFSTNNEFC